MGEAAIFGSVLDLAVEALNQRAREAATPPDPAQFEKWVLAALQAAAAGCGMKVEPSFHPHAFPDIVVNGFGVEVKSTNKDSWLSVGNSVFEGMRDPATRHVFVVFGKFGGLPAVRWKPYEDAITHVRISHAPRFVLEMADEMYTPLFTKLGIGYSEFCGLSPEEKMRHIRKYTRSRLKKGESMWWLEDAPGEEKTLPLEIRVYMNLPREEKRKLRAEAAILCPEVVGPSRKRGKYNRAALYALTVHGVYCNNARDLFSAGSVAGKNRKKHGGGNYLPRALADIEKEMKQAALALSGKLIEEYWGEAVAPAERLGRWLQMADSKAAGGWVPSKRLFLNSGGPP